jgi:hypothetical protein
LAISKTILQSWLVLTASIRVLCILEKFYNTNNKRNKRCNSEAGRNERNTTADDRGTAGYEKK